MSTSSAMATILVVTGMLAIVCITLTICWIQQRRAAWAIPIAECGLVALAIITGAAWWLWVLVALATIAFLWLSLKMGWFGRRWFKGMCVVLMALSLFAYGINAYRMFQELRASLPTPKSTTARTEAPKTNPSSTLDPRFIQEAGDHTGNKVDAGFESAVASATSKGGDVSTHLSDTLLARAGHNAQRLAIWSSAFGLYNDPNNWQCLTTANGKYLSQEGIELYYKLEGALKASGTKVSESKAPANGTNSGVVKGTYGASSTSGISGNRKAIKVILKNGTVVYIMYRCGNVVYVKAVPPKIPRIELEPKKASEDVGANPNVDSWKKDDTGGDASKGHQVTNDDGSRVANGYQPHPQTDAADAARVAADRTAAEEAAQQDAAASTTKVDDDQAHTSIAPPSW